MGGVGKAWGQGHASNSADCAVARYQIIYIIALSICTLCCTIKVVLKSLAGDTFYLPWGRPCGEFARRPKGIFGTGLGALHKSLAGSLAGSLASEPCGRPCGRLAGPCGDLLVTIGPKPARLAMIIPTPLMRPVSWSPTGVFLAQGRSESKLSHMRKTLRGPCGRGKTPCGDLAGEWRF